MIDLAVPITRVRYVVCKNNSGEEIPAFAVMRVTGVTDEVLQVAKPNAASDTKAAVNGPTPIPIGGHGNATYDSPFFVLYDTGDGTPTFGDMWGTESGSWKLRAANDGFCALGGAVAGHAWFSSGGSMGGGTGTLTVEETDGAPSVANVSLLRFDPADGYVVSTTGAGIARVDHASASLTQAGIVDLVAQTLGDGDKTFASDAVFSYLAGPAWNGAGGGANRARLTLFNVGGGAADQFQLNLPGVGGVQFATSLLVQAGLVEGYARLQQILGSAGTVFFSVADAGGTFDGTTGTGLSAVTVRGGLVISGVATLTVPSGGTGATTLTANGVLYGAGTSALVATAAGTTGQVLTATSASAPTWQALPEVSFIQSGIVNLSEQVFGMGLKFIETLGINQLAGPLTASNVFECNGESLFYDPLRMASTNGLPGEIEAYDSTNTGMKLRFIPRGGGPLLEIIQITLRSDADTLKAELRATGTDGDDVFDLVHSDTNTPRFAVNGTLGITETVKSATVTTTGGIVTAMESGIVFTSTASATVANTTTETTLIGSGVGSLTLATNRLAAGKTLRIRARGYWGTDAAVAGTMRWRVKLGSTTVLDTGAITPAIAITNLFWQLDAEIVCRTTGGSGTVFAQGYTDRQEVAEAALLAVTMVNTATTTINTTVTQAIDVTFEWGTADAENTITCSNVTIEILN